jgi:tyrosyl-tRNA synthetase
MIRKVIGSENKACCFSVPLLLKPDGTKFGKSESGSIYLDPKMTTPFEMYQFFFNQPDSQVEELLKKFTFLSKSEIEEICERHTKEPSTRIAQKALAQQVITDIHGNTEYKKCLKISNALYTNSLHDLTPAELYSALSGTRKFDAQKSSSINKKFSYIRKGKKDYTLISFDK